MRKSIIIVSACIVALLLGYTGYRGYKVWKEKHWLTMAREFAANADLRNASLSLQQVLRLNPKNLDACRLMANVADAIHSPSALVWRQRVLDLQPQSLQNRLALAQTALAFNELLLASNVLAGVDDAGKNTAIFQNAAGMLSTGLRQLPQAEKHFAEALRLDPGNASLQMNLSVMRLHSTNALDQAEARIEMKRISLNSTNTALRSQALRELVLDAMHNEDFKTALTVCQDLVRATNAPFSDRILQLDLFHRAKSSEYPAALLACQREAAAPEKMAMMANWLLQQNKNTETLTWLQSLPLQTRTNQPAALLISQCQLNLLDWHGLQATLQNQDWGILEYLRHALLARSLREQNLAGASAAEWGVAAKFANEEKGNLIALFRVAAQWQWNDEAQQLLWTVVNKCPEEKWAGPALTQVLLARGSTRPLMQLFDTLSKRAPADLEMRNNLAVTALLLGAQELNPTALAQEVYDKAPTNPACASTYAYSLYLQKKYPEALKIMQKLTPAQLKDPGTAGYYGIILKAAGDPVKAKAYLTLAAKAQVLPEERKMFDEALAN